ncbi:hypothetical protein SKAU_G00320580 [Synaphobranchus kaupii]|uniref:Zinc finger CCHC domain-containing protein n=1 Tax=Synaphobranchus kaupii TaxID=118154 RepID=A0A9Q1ENS5_SYNKA|nr:hypothetical protein SKAU_G00320580 [Synaphobranchus kaupii]
MAPSATFQSAAPGLKNTLRFQGKKDEMTPRLVFGRDLLFGPLQLQSQDILCLQQNTAESYFDANGNSESYLKKTWRDTTAICTRLHLSRSALTGAILYTLVSRGSAENVTDTDTQRRRAPCSGAETRNSWADCVDNQTPSDTTGEKIELTSEWTTPTGRKKRTRKIKLVSSSNSPAPPTAADVNPFRLLLQDLTAEEESGTSDMETAPDPKEETVAPPPPSSVSSGLPPSGAPVSQPSEASEDVSPKTLPFSLGESPPNLDRCFPDSGQNEVHYL